MDKKISFLAITLLLFSTSYLYAKDVGFDEICRIYTEAKNSSLKKQQLSDYINTNISARISNKDALTTHSIIPQASPAERYQLFKKSAEHSLKRKWDCDAMKIIIK